jgi:hypothetical protein
MIRAAFRKLPERGRRGRSGPVLLAGLAVVFVLLASGAAQAYPQWQFSSGTSRCGQCHFSPAGGGLITGYARDAVGEELSTWEGEGGFLHGAVDLPKALALGFDGRYALMGHDAAEARGPKQSHFPMQADVHARVALSDALSAYVSAGFRGQARAADQPLGASAPQPAGGSRFISREHYVQWRPQAIGPYVRAGRFYAPYGLRLAEHYAYVRRDTGFNLLQESYNLSGGLVRNEWELHVTAFAPDFIRGIGSNEMGVAALYERRVGDASALGLQTRIGLGTDANRYAGGGFWKTYFENWKTLVQTEVNLVHSAFQAAIPGTQSFVGYLGLTFFPFRGLWVTPFAERLQTSIGVGDSATNAGGVQLNWFPYPHFELVWMGRVQAAAGGATVKTGLLFLHYYL